MSSYSLPVIVEPAFEFFVPNAFTPDDDGVNDYFVPQGIGFLPEDYKLTIYDRWGELIFVADNYNIHWDGKVKNKIAKNDVYVWEVVIIDFQGKKRHFTGHVTIFK